MAHRVRFEVSKSVHGKFQHASTLDERIWAQGRNEKNENDRKNAKKMQETSSMGDLNKIVKVSPSPPLVPREEKMQKKVDLSSRLYATKPGATLLQGASRQRKTALHDNEPHPKPSKISLATRGAARPKLPRVALNNFSVGYDSMESMDDTVTLSNAIKRPPNKMDMKGRKAQEMSAVTLDPFWQANIRHRPDFSKSPPLRKAKVDRGPTPPSRSKRSSTQSPVAVGRRSMLLRNGSFLSSLRQEDSYKIVIGARGGKAVDTHSNNNSRRPSVTQTPEDPEKYMYLVPDVDNFYKLHALPHPPENGDNYYTLSTGGLLWHQDGEDEFIPIEDFDMEMSQHDSLRKYNIFKDYRRWKTFRVWVQYVIGRKRGHAVQVLKSQLFLTHPTLSIALIELSSCCQKLKTTKLYALDPSKTHLLEDFVEEQIAQRNKVVDIIENFLENVHDLVLDSCEKSLKRFLNDGNYTDLDKAQFDQAKTSRQESSDAELKEKEITFTERAAMRTECRRLTRFVRLCDFLVADTFVAMAMDSVNMLCSHMKRAFQRISGAQIQNMGVCSADDDPGKSKVNKQTAALIRKSLRQSQMIDAAKVLSNVRSIVMPLLQIDVIPGLDQDIFEDVIPGCGEDAEGLEGKNDYIILFSPSEQSVQDAMEYTLAEGLATVTTQARMLVHPDFEIFVRTTVEEAGEDIGEGLDLESIVLDDPEFQQTIQNIRACIQDSFERAAEFMKKMEPLMDQYAENIEFQSSTSLDTMQNATIEELRTLLEKFTQQQQYFSKLVKLHSLGLLRLNLEKADLLLRPSPNLCLEILHQLIPEAYLKRNQVLFEEINEGHNFISQEPETVRNFADLTVKLEHLNGRKAAVEEEFQYLTAMFKLMEDFNFEIDDDLKTSAGMLKHMHEDFVKQLAVTEMTYPDYHKMFSDDLRQQIHELYPVVKEIAADLMLPFLDDANTDVGEAVRHLKIRETKLRMLSERAVVCENYQRILKVEFLEREDLDKAIRDMQIKLRLWAGLEEWKFLTDIWLELPYLELDVEETQEKTEQFWESVLICEEELGPRGSVICLKTMVAAFRNTLPIIANLKCGVLQHRHRLAMNSVLGFIFPSTASSLTKSVPFSDMSVSSLQSQSEWTVRSLMEKASEEVSVKIQKVATEAREENRLAELIRQVASSWDHAEFNIVHHKEARNIFLLGDSEECKSLLEDSAVTLQSIYGSPYVGPLYEEVTEWRVKISSIQRTLALWEIFQKRWEEYGIVFSTPDISRQLPSELRTFNSIDSYYKDIMLRIYHDPNCIKVTFQQNLLDSFKNYMNILDRVQKGLRDYLDAKRQAFPRLYFISDQEILSINGTDPSAVRPHLAKLFGGIGDIEFERGADSVSVTLLAMISPEGERVELPKNLKARGGIEEWLNSLLDASRKSVQRAMKNTFVDRNAYDQVDWVRRYPCQCLCIVYHVEKTEYFKKALSRGNPNVALALEELLNHWQRDINTFIQMHATFQDRTMQLKLHHMIVQAIQHRDTAMQFLSNNVENTSAYLWQAQMRFHWDEDCSSLTVHQGASSGIALEYGFEYQGIGESIVITPLSDRCYRAIIAAWAQDYGVSLVGSCLSGRNSLIMKISRAVGYFVAMFTCHKLGPTTMGALLRGACQTGTCCLYLQDLQHTTSHTLAVLSQHVSGLRWALRQQDETYQLDDTTVKVSKYYLAASILRLSDDVDHQIPENLRTCFRPVSIVSPELDVIARVLIEARGFHTSSKLASKLIFLLKSCDAVLSNQPHYHFGASDIATIIQNADKIGLDEQYRSEEDSIVKAIHASFTYKIVAQDKERFLGLLNAIFQGHSTFQPEETDILNHIGRAFDQAQLHVRDKQMAQIQMLHQSLQATKAVALVGASMSGKSTAYQMLRKAYEIAHQDECSLKGEDAESKQNPLRVHIKIIYPGVSSKEYMYGFMLERDQEWKDGLVVSGLRQAFMTQDEQFWLVFDGVMKADWVEILNAVMDHTFALSLASGERVMLCKNSSFIFECINLLHASPSCINRITLVQIENDGLSLMEMLKNWRASFQADQECDFLHLLRSKSQSIIVKIAEPAINFVLLHNKSWAAPSKEYLLVSFLRLFNALLIHYSEVMNKTTDDFELDQCLEQIVTFVTIWGGAGYIHGDPEKESDFTFFFRDLVAEQTESGTLPDFGSVFDFCLDIHLWQDRKTSVMHLKPEWQPWKSKVSAIDYEPQMTVPEIFIPTPETAKYATIMRYLVGHSKHVIVTGPSSSGRTKFISFQLRTWTKQKESLTWIPGKRKLVQHQFALSSISTSGSLQNALEARLLRKKSNLLGAPQGAANVVFVDDLNLPSNEATQPIELVHQILKEGGFYDRDKLSWTRVDDTVFLATVPSHCSVTPRNLRNFNVIHFADIDRDCMVFIFGTIISTLLKQDNFSEEITEIKDGIAEATIDIFRWAYRTLRPSPSRCEYGFNLQAVMQMIQGMFLASSDDVVSKEQFGELWLHEACRVYEDRIYDCQELDSFEEMICELTRKHLKLDGERWKRKNLFSENKTPFIFSQILNSDKSYQFCSDMDYLHTHLQKFQKKSTKISSQCLIFPDTICQLVGLLRILRQAWSHAVLLGAGGSGRRLAIRVAAAVGAWKVTELPSSDHTGNGLDKQRKALRDAIWDAGVHGLETVLSVHESHLWSPEILGDLECLFKSGLPPPGWNTAEEESELLLQMRAVAREMGVSDTPDECRSLFEQRLGKNLTVMIILCNDQRSFRHTCSKFPSIIKCATVIYFHQWSLDSLIKVANYFLDETEEAQTARESIDPVLITQLPEAFGEMHEIVQHAVMKYETETGFFAGVGAKPYMDHMQFFLKVYKEHSNIIRGYISKLEKATKKLEEIDELCHNHTTDIGDLEGKITLKILAIKRMNREIEEHKSSFHGLQTQLQREIEQINDELSATSEAQRLMTQLSPELDNAVNSVHDLAEIDWKDLASLIPAPEPIQLVWQALCICLNVPPLTAEAENIWEKPNLAEELENYQIDQMNDVLRSKLQPIIQSILETSIERHSKAASAVAAWIKAVFSFSEALDLARKEIAEKNGDTDEKMSGSHSTTEMDESHKSWKQSFLKMNLVLRKSKGNIEIVQKKKAEEAKEHEKLSEELENKKDRLEIGERLLEKLKEERDEWILELSTMEKKEEYLVGNAMLASGYQAYLGRLHWSYRDKIINEWKDALTCLGIYSVPKFSFTEMADFSQIVEWQQSGLGSDQATLENAVLLSMSQTVSFVIDPHGLGLKFIRILESQSTLKICKSWNPKLTTYLESSLKLGLVMVVRDVEDRIPPLFEMVVDRKIPFTEDSPPLVVGDEEIQVHPNFRLYLLMSTGMTRERRSISSKSPIIDFSVSEEGITECLVNEIISVDNVSLEEHRLTLLQSQASDTKQLKAATEKLLYLLNDSVDTLLEDNSIVNTLASIKVTSNIMKERMEESKFKLQHVIDEKGQYSGVANLAAIVLYTMDEVAVLDPMYRWGLDYFVQEFRKYVEAAPRNDDVTIRVAELFEIVKEKFFFHFVHGIHQGHRLAFAFIFITKLLVLQRKIKENDLLFLLKGSTKMPMRKTRRGSLIKKGTFGKMCPKRVTLFSEDQFSSEQSRPVRSQLNVVTAANPNPSIFEEGGWSFLQEAELALPEMRGLCYDIVLSEMPWKEWLQSGSPATQPLPGKWEEKLTDLQKIILYKAVCKTAVADRVKMFIEKNMGPEYAPPYILPALKTVCDQLDYRMPCLLHLSDGWDPAPNLQRILDTGPTRGKLRMVNLGSKGMKLEEVIEDAKIHGHWVFIHDAHFCSLASLRELEAIIESNQEEEETMVIHSSFQLFISSKSIEYMPLGIVRRSSKLTYGAEQSLKTSMAHIYNECITHAVFNTLRSNRLKRQDGHRFLFGLSMFHAVCQQRTHFPGLGFIEPYSFKDPVLDEAISILINGLQDDIPLENIFLSTDDVCHSMQATNKWDLRCFQVLRKHFYGQHNSEGAFEYTREDDYSPITEEGTLEMYQKHIHGMPVEHEEAVIGLHQKENELLKGKGSISLLNTLNDLVIKKKHKQVTTKATDERVLVETALMLQILEKGLKNKSQAPPQSQESSSNIHTDELLLCCQREEIQEVALLFQKMRWDLTELLAGVEGRIPMNDQMNALYHSILEHKVPDRWALTGSLYLKPVKFWMEDLVLRMDYLMKWQKNKIIIHQLSMLFRPKRFLTAVLHDYSCSKGLSMSNMLFRAKIVTDNPETPSERGVYISGLVMRGGSIDLSRHELIDNPGHTSGHSEVPVLHFVPEVNLSPDPNYYECPIFQHVSFPSGTGTKLDFLTSVHLKTSEKVDHWVMRGTSMILSTDPNMMLMSNLQSMSRASI